MERRGGRKKGRQKIERRREKKDNYIKRMR